MQLTAAPPGISPARSRGRAVLRHAAALSLLVGGLLLYAGWLARDDARFPWRSGDQMNIQLMIMKSDRPDLFPRDHVFSDPSIFRFYTPSFRGFVGWLNRWTGGLDATVHLLLPIQVSFYALGMYVLIHDVTRSVAASVAVTAASSLLFRVMGSEFWGVASARAVVPRSAFLALLPWLVIALLRWWRGGPAWLLPACGLGAGLAANIHPVSGLGLTEIVLLMSLARRPPTMKTLGATLLTALLALAGAAPMVLHFVTATASPAPADFPFTDFRSALRAHHKTFFPFGWDPFVLTVLAAGWAGSMAAWLVALGKARRGPAVDSGPLFACGLLLQLPAAGAITLFRCWPLIAMAGAYAWLSWRRRRPDAVDWALLAWMACVIGIALAGTCALDALWGRFEIWGITSLAGEHGRAGRFLLLPLFLLAARLIAHVTTPAPVRLRWIAALAMGAVLAVPQVREAIRHRARVQEGIARRADLLSAAAWARRESPLDALFYTDSLEFRLSAERSITHCWKDLGLSYYTRSRFFSVLARYDVMEAARGDAAALEALGRKHGIDYILETTSRPLPFPVAYANGHYRLYRLSAPPG